MKGGIEVWLLCTGHMQISFLAKEHKTFCGVELLSWGSSECPIQMHFFRGNPLGSKHIAETFWIFKGSAQAFLVFYSRVFFVFFLSPLNTHCFSTNPWWCQLRNPSCSLFPLMVSQSFSCPPDWWLPTNSFLLQLSIVFYDSNVGRENNRFCGGVWLLFFFLWRKKTNPFLNIQFDQSGTLDFTRIESLRFVLDHLILI